MPSDRQLRKPVQMILFGKKAPACGGVLDVELSIPTHFRCPISLELMKDPVMVSTGITYDRQSIETWIEMGNGSCPVTNQPLPSDELIPNHCIRRLIQEWCVANKSYGIQRIPTPRIPVSPVKASEMLFEIDFQGRRGDGARCRQLVAKVKALAKESERNRRCFLMAGAGQVLSSSFSSFAAPGASSDNAATPGLLEDILSALTTVRPLDEEALRHLGSPESLDSLVSILGSGDLAARLNAVLVVKELVSSNRAHVNTIAETQGLVEALVKLIKEPISPQATKATLVATFFLISTSSEKTASTFADMGLVSLLVEVIVDSEKSMCEKALAVLDAALSCETGREKARSHALTIPVLVKKMFRVSDMSTEFAVSALWKLCCNVAHGKEEEEEAIVIEVLQVGAFQKLLLLLQVGCSGRAKEKATELLRLLNASKGKVGCTADSMDLRGLKRPF